MTAQPNDLPPLDDAESPDRSGTMAATASVWSGLGILRNAQLRRFLIAGLFSGFGTYVQAIAAGWVMASLTPRVSTVALVQTASSLPILLLALLSGALADVYDRRRLLLAAQVMMLTSAVCLALATASGHITPWALLGLTFVMGAGLALHSPAWQATLGDITPKEALGDAVTLNSLGANTARSVGPALGGLILTTLGATAAFVFNALSYLGIIWTLWRWKPVRDPRSLPPERLIAAIGTGIRFAALSRPVRDGLLRALVFGVVSSSIWALTPVLARDVLDEGPQIYGFLLAAFGGGAVCGATLNALLRRRLGHEGILTGASLTFALAVSLAGLATSLVPALIAQFFAGAAWVSAMAVLNVHVQTASPRWVVGRTVSMFQMSAFGGMALGSFAFGLMADVLGVPMALGASGLLMALTLVLRFRLPLMPLDPADLEMAPPQSHVSLATSLDARSPTVVSIDYRIRLADTERFLALMDRNAEARHRAGATRWRLYRDGFDLQLWTEQFESEDWTEHLRHRRRRSKSDQDIQLALWALHDGTEPPRIRRLLRERRL